MKGVTLMFKKLQKHAGEVLEFPSDILGNEPKITIIGRTEMIIEYFLEVVLFSDQEIILKTASGKLSIKGKGFVLALLLQTEIHVKGEITQLSFEEEV
jgi:sporulation protein YqfC